MSLENWQKKQWKKFKKAKKQLDGFLERGTINQAEYDEKYKRICEDYNMDWKGRR